MTAECDPARNDEPDDGDHRGTDLPKADFHSLRPEVGDLGRNDGLLKLPSFNGFVLGHLDDTIGKAWLDLVVRAEDLRDRNRTRDLGETSGDKS